MPASKFTQEIFEHICNETSKGVTYAQLMRDNSNVPPMRTFHDWTYRDEVLSAKFASARAEGYNMIADECLRIADDSTKDSIETERGTVMDAEWVQRSKLRIETRLKLLAKWAPKLYGDKIDVTSDGDKIQQTVIMMPSNNRDDSK